MKQSDIKRQLDILHDIQDDDPVDVVDRMCYVSGKCELSLEDIVEKFLSNSRGESVLGRGKVTLSMIDVDTGEPVLIKEFDNDSSC